MTDKSPSPSARTELTAGCSTMDASVSSISGSGFSRFIRHNLDAIVAEWETFARSIDTTREMSVAELRDHSREILLGVASDMEEEQSAAQREAKARGLADSDEMPERGSITHGVRRHLSGFNLVQVVAEFRALRASVLALWQRSIVSGAEPAALEQIIRFNEAIDRALADSVKSYAARVEVSRELFLAILGHDLRGPLSTIGLCCAALDRPELDRASRANSVTVVKRATQDMKQLIDDLLEFTRSRLGAGIPIERAGCDLGRLCEQAVDSLRASHPEQVLTFHADGDLHLQADARRLQQVLSNLLYNALQHGDRRSPVRLQARGEVNAVILEVGNMGAPIPADALPTIFDPLIRVPAPGSHQPDERSRTSLGLGLYIVREIVRGHDGTVAVQSARDTGTVFTICLPRAPHGSPATAS